MHIALFSQITDDFTDGELLNSPTWYLDTGSFEIINPPISGDGSINSSANNDGAVLRSKQNLSDAVLLTQSTQAFGEWRFSVADGANWSISGLNDYKIIIISDDSTRSNLLDGSENFNGYYLRFDGDNADQFNLYKQNGTTSTIILSTSYPTSTDGATPVGRTIKVIRTATGDWSVFIDEGFEVEPTTQRGPVVNDNTFSTSSWFGIVTNIGNPSTARVLYFDNLYIGNIIADTVPPHVINYQIISQNQIDLSFNENIDTTSGQNISNYIIDNSIGSPDSALIDQTTGSLIHLYFSNPLVSGTNYNLTITNISDFDNNVMADTTISFFYYIISKYDIVINEIMADPNPPVYLPDYEYVELYNTTPYNLTLSNWKITVGSSTKTIPNITIYANDYLILCDDAAINDFSTYGNVAGISSFPALTNTGATITIKNENDTIISTVTYSDSWYQDPAKDDGGWSLEKIDPLNNCGGISNWKASENLLGGTPGSINSVYASNIDTTAPYVVNVYVRNSMELSVLFSETIIESSINLNNITINNGIGNPVFYTQDSNYEQLYHFQFMNPFTHGTNYQFTINGIYDDCGNTMSSQNISFTYYQAQQFDIVINEIMADPTPAIGLPEYEYLELYNRSDYEINLTDWQIKVGSSSYTLPVCSILPDDYLIITSDDGYSSFQSFGNTISLLGSTTLTNSGNTINLYNELGQLIHSVTYSDTWYKDNYKKEGGWSLEQIDPDNPCTGEDNWIASNSNTGGTPGSINSVFESNPDIVHPYPVRAVLITPDSLKVFFNETIDTTTIIDLTSYNIDNGIGNPISIDPVQPDYTKLILKLPQTCTAGVIYTLTITDSISDCSSNLISEIKNSVRFAIPDSAEYNDIIINEVLFNPYPEGVDFVEIYNNSSKVINLSDLRIASRDENTMEIDPVKTIDDEGFLMFPEEYYVLSTDKNIIQNIYYCPDSNAFINISSIPSYNDDEGYVTLTDKWLNIIDEFHYYDDFHFELLKNTEGVSLERIYFDNPTQDRDNWHSAAETVGFATPGYKNSQSSDNNIAEDEITIEPEIFSPDNDGYNDVLSINYNFGKPGYVANINIFDSKGRLIRKLVSNELLATSGTFTWNGITDYDAKANIGIYIIYIEIFDLNGNVKKYKKSCVLAAKLK
ncbi:MAG: hypothetical protein Kow0068_00040 [Marinilabiliales bacterium]